MIDNNEKLYLLHNIFCSERHIGEDLIPKVMNYKKQWREEIAGSIKEYTHLLKQEIEELEELKYRMFLNEFIVKYII